MKKHVVALVLGLALVGGVGVGVAANALTGSSLKETPSATAGLVSASELVVKPGAVGPVRAGMSKADALMTGYLVEGASNGVEGCPTPPLAWRKAYQSSLDVYTLGNGEITSVGIRGKGPRTRGGLGVGSTYAAVTKAADAPAVEAGYSQSGVFIYDGQNGGYVGFLFNEPVAQLTKASKVTFVEVTKGAQPNLMRDGC